MNFILRAGPSRDQYPRSTGRSMPFTFFFTLPWVGLDLRWKPTGYISSTWVCFLRRDLLCFNTLRYRAACQIGVGAFCVELGFFWERWLSCEFELFHPSGLPGYSPCWEPLFCLGCSFFVHGVQELLFSATVIFLSLI